MKLTKIKNTNETNSQVETRSIMSDIDNEIKKIYEEISEDKEDIKSMDELIKKNELKEYEHFTRNTVNIYNAKIKIIQINELINLNKAKIEVEKLKLQLTVFKFITIIEAIIMSGLIIGILK